RRGQDPYPHVLDAKGTPVHLRPAKEPARTAAGHRAGRRCSMITTFLHAELGFSPHNIEGYPDPTAYSALKNLQRAEYGYRPLVYICSPYSGDVEANMELAQTFCAHAVARCKIPLAPHLLFPQFMDDNDPETRELAMFFNRILLSKCEAIWVYTARV